MTFGSHGKRLFKCIFAIMAAALSLWLAGCGRPATASGDEPYVYDFFAADTYINLKVYGAADPESLCRQVEEKTAELENVISRHLADSEVAEINAGPAGEYELSDDLAAVVSASLEAAGATGGAYDPTIAPLSSLWTSAAAMIKSRAVEIDA